MIKDTVQTGPLWVRAEDLVYEGDNQTALWAKMVLAELYAAPAPEDGIAMFYVSKKVAVAMQRLLTAAINVEYGSKVVKTKVGIHLIKDNMWCLAVFRGDNWHTLSEPSEKESNG